MTALDKEELIAKAKVLLETLPYIQKFRGSIFVVKYGGSFMDDPSIEVRGRILRDIMLLEAVGIRVVLVHGGGKAISRAMEAAGLEPRFINGLRYTDKPSIAVVEKTLNQEINQEICELLQDRGGHPQALLGNQVFSCKPYQAKDEQGHAVDLGYVGEITHVDTAPIHAALKANTVPIVSPIAVDSAGHPYNTNADIAASRVAIALQAQRLVYLCDLPGLLRDPKDESTLISTLHMDKVAELKKAGIIAEGMRPKVDSAVEALQQGIQRVHFVDGRLPHSLLLEIFTDHGIGTEIIM